MFNEKMEILSCLLEVADCKYADACGNAENCLRCTGYEPQPMSCYTVHYDFARLTRGGDKN